MASTNLSNSIIGTITMSHNDSLGPKLVFLGDNYFLNVPFFILMFLMKIHE